MYRLLQILTKRSTTNNDIKNRQLKPEREESILDNFILGMTNQKATSTS